MYKPLILLLLLTIAGQGLYAQTAQKTVIQLQVNQWAKDTSRFAAGDSLMLICYAEKQYHEKLVQKQVAGKRNPSGSWRFETELTAPCYFTICNLSKLTSRNMALQPFSDGYLEPGDEVKILLRPGKDFTWGRGEYLINYFISNLFGSYHPSFSGKGSLKFRVKYLADSLVLNQPGVEGNAKTKAGTMNPNAIFFKGIDKGLKVLSMHQKAIGNNTCNILKADLLAGLGEAWLLNYYSGIIAAPDKTDTLYFERFYAGYKQYRKTWMSQLSVYAKNNSVMLPGFLAQEYLIFKNFARKSAAPEITYRRIIDDITADYNGVLRDKILLEILKYDQRGIKQDLSVLLQMMANMEYDKYKQLLLEFADNNMPGKPAYNFALQNHKGDTVRLSDFKGKVVFIDFWYTGCGGCSGYYKKVLKPVEAAYKGNPGVVFITVSIDQAKERWLGSVETGDYTSAETAINLYTNGLGAQHPIVSNYGIFGYPRPMLIDKSGNIFNTNIEDLRSGGPDQLIATIEKALAPAK